MRLAPQGQYCGVRPPSDTASNSFGDSTVVQPVSTTLQASMLTEEAGDESFQVFHDEDPDEAVARDLYSNFLHCLRASQADDQVLGLLGQYEDACTEIIERLKHVVNRSVPGQDRHKRAQSLLQLLTQERCTWRLIGSLQHDRQRDNEPMCVDTLGKYQTEKQLMLTLYENDTTVRHGQLVIDWLEKNAEEQLDNYYDQVEFFTDQTGAWENTLHVLAQKRNGICSEQRRPIVDHMDPDAPIREGLPLADLDMEDEARLLKYLFAYVRAGQLSEAQRFLMKVGQSWRAATLEGWKLYHDPNYESLGPDGVLRNPEGNMHRDIWKAACWRLAQEEKMSVYERAVYATYSGNLDQLLPVCHTWEDHLWAYLRVMVDVRLEQEVRINSALAKQWQKLPDRYWNHSMTIEAAFHKVEASPSQKVQIEAKEPFHLMQKYIILDDADSLVEEMYEWCRDDSVKAPPQLVRFMAHIVLLFRTIGKSVKEKLCIAILETYVKQLIEEHQVALIATYTATLPQDLQIECYAKFLEGVQQADDRRQCLALAEEAGLDVARITKLVVENIRSADSVELSMDMQLLQQTATTDEDRSKINAIDWLVFDPSQRAEALKQANAIMRMFVGTRKLSAARDVFNKLPAGSYRSHHPQLEKTGNVDLCAEDENAIREYLCVKAYLDANDGFNDWFEHYHDMKPEKPAMATGANFTERVAFEHRQKQYENELERWRHTLMMQTKDCERDMTRMHQMRLLRQLCLPPLCFLLHTILHSTEQLNKCLQLADVIASEQYKLYQVFQRAELQKFLQKLRESSIALLDTGCDALGYKFE
ncbi:hypothetical protein NP493_941g02002 [Ridgeia piscesae]|uniref:Nuclear pore complex protein n=1 Tax=Ridgeia piscesae TaxID=27915 RepID=A0AAD9KJX2_RIDPI|nr:hypothetical protein NP493_941g02002 [Ridgeia piscesae]